MKEQYYDLVKNVYLLCVDCGWMDVFLLFLFRPLSSSCVFQSGLKVCRAKERESERDKESERVCNTHQRQTVIFVVIQSYDFVVVVDKVGYVVCRCRRRRSCRWVRAYVSAVPLCVCARLYVFE